ncbi:hypothetical protein [Streptomyces yaizuensis]|uniref:Tail assembly chaperone n=1 Tax=Streptomyces yaizuensis TaxID=2989713 RepID=A0AA86IXW4_9ACTN|nr:hypothetical protein [Streptomyces sp. YSPA8]BDT39530.1 hypothetical protein SYYSPA8_37060 [Streptomyces sp. YSPA8]
MATVVSTADYTQKIAEDIPARIGSVSMTARCPKDVVWNELAKRHEAGDTSGSESMLMYLSAAIFGTDNGEKIRAMLDDPDNREVTYTSLGGVIGYLVEKWGPEAQAHFEALQAGTGNRQARRLAAKKTTAKKTAAKQVPRKRAAASRR